MSVKDGMVKIQLIEGEWVETPWATPVADYCFRLENTPFYAYRLSFEDIVEAKPRFEGDLPTFVRVVKKSGRRTVRVSTKDGMPVPKNVIDTLRALGISYEGVSPKYLCYDIPPEIELQQVVDQLLQWDESEIIWEHADPTWEDLHGPE